MSDPAAAFRAAAGRALTAANELLAASRALGSGALAATDVPLLCELVRSRIHTLTAFEHLVELDQVAAREVLIDRWLGAGVDPDTRFGGFTFELSAMLDDLRELAGESALRALIADPRIPPARLADPRVVEAIAQALDLEPSAAAAWIAERR